MVFYAGASCTQRTRSLLCLAPSCRTHLTTASSPLLHCLPQCSALFLLHDLIMAPVTRGPAHTKAAAAAAAAAAANASSTSSLPHPTDADLAQVRLSLTKQESLDADRFTLDGQLKRLHYVIKNQNYIYELTLSSTALDFSHFHLEVELLYDNADKKEITSLRVKPIAFRASVCPTDARRMLVDAMIAILSSHHEDMNFVLRFFLVDSRTKLRLAHATVDSEPICVISKPEVLDKKKNPKKRKRTTANDTILSMLQRIEQEQQAQRAAIAELRQAATSTAADSTTTAVPARRRAVAARSGPATVPSLSPSGSSASPSTSYSMMMMSSSSSSDSFEEAFRTLLHAYVDMSADERSSKIRKLASEQMQDPSAHDLLYDLWQGVCCLGTGPLLDATTASPAADHHDSWLGHALSASTSFEELASSPLGTLAHDDLSSASSSASSSPSHSSSFLDDDQQQQHHQVSPSYMFLDTAGVSIHDWNVDRLCVESLLG